MYEYNFPELFSRRENIGIFIQRSVHKTTKTTYGRKKLFMRKIIRFIDENRPRGNKWCTSRGPRSRSMNISNWKNLSEHEDRTESPHARPKMKHTNIYILFHRTSIQLSILKPHVAPSDRRARPNSPDLINPILNGAMDLHRIVHIRMYIYDIIKISGYK